MHGSVIKDGEDQHNHLEVVKLKGEGKLDRNIVDGVVLQFGHDVVNIAQSKEWHKSLSSSSTPWQPASKKTVEADPAG